MMLPSGLPAMYFKKPLGDSTASNALNTTTYMALMAENPSNNADGSTTLFRDNWQVRMHELIGRGVAEARRRKGLTQEQAARRFQGGGSGPGVGGRCSADYEAGLRRPGLDEVLLDG